MIVNIGQVQTLTEANGCCDWQVGASSGQALRRLRPPQGSVSGVDFPSQVRSCPSNRSDRRRARELAGRSIRCRPCPSLAFSLSLCVGSVRQCGRFRSSERTTASDTACERAVAAEPVQSDRSQLLLGRLIEAPKKVFFRLQVGADLGSHRRLDCNSSGSNCAIRASYQFAQLCVALRALLWLVFARNQNDG